MPGTLTKKQLAVAIVSSAVLLSVGVAGCNRTQTAEELIAEAQQYQKKGDRKAALIQLKNAVVQHPENADARLRLGTLQLELGDFASADKELRKAASLGISEDKTLPLVARAMLQQGKFKELLEEITPEQAKASPILLARRGDAFLALREIDKAKEAYEAALAVNENSGDGYIGLARLAGTDLALASRLITEATTRDAGNPEVWMMMGILHRSQGKNDEALKAFDKALAINPLHRSAHVEKAFVHIGTKDFAAAKADIDAAKQYWNGDLSVTYAQALLFHTEGKQAEAKESLQNILKHASEHMPSVLLMGAVELELGGNQQAEQHLRKYLENVPNDVRARKLLAQALLKSNQSAEAATVLTPALKNNNQDAQLLALAGQSYLQLREFDKASTYLEQASALAPEAAGIRTSLGLSKMAQGDWNKAIGELEQAAKLDPKSMSAGLALVEAEMRRGNFDQALAAVQTLEKAQPDNPMVHSVKGGVYLGKKDLEKARASFEKALTLNPSFMPAVMNLARFDLAAKNPAAAKKRFEAVLAKDRTNIEAMNALASLELSQSKVADAISWLEKAHTENPDKLAPALRLANTYLSAKQADKALALMRKTLTAHPADPAALDLMGQVQVANKDLNGALESYGKLTAAVPKSTAGFIRLASVQMMLKNDNGAADSLKRALSIDPQLLQARLGQIELANRSGKHEEALAIARQIQIEHPKKVTGLLVEGDLLLAQKKTAPALAAFEKAYAMSNAPEVLVKIHQVLMQNGKAAEAQARIAKYHAAHPENGTIGMLLAENHLVNRQFKPAISALQTVLKTTPSNPIALNNLAWAYQQENDPRALATAEQAYKVGGENPAILDTLGWILVQQGNTARGVELLRKAVNASPKSPDLRFHLAAALAKTGDKAAARKEVEQSLAMGIPFPAADEAKALLRQL